MYNVIRAIDDVFISNLLEEQLDIFRVVMGKRRETFEYMIKLIHKHNIYFGFYFGFCFFSTSIAGVPLYPSGIGCCQ